MTRTLTSKQVRGATFKSSCGTQTLKYRRCLPWTGAISGDMIPSRPPPSLLTYHVRRHISRLPGGKTQEERAVLSEIVPRTPDSRRKEETCFIQL